MPSLNTRRNGTSAPRRRLCGSPTFQYNNWTIYLTDSDSDLDWDWPFDPMEFTLHHPISSINYMHSLRQAGPAQNRLLGRKYFVLWIIFGRMFIIYSTLMCFRSPSANYGQRSWYQPNGSALEFRINYWSHLKGNRKESLPWMAIIYDKKCNAWLHCSHLYTSDQPDGDHEEDAVAGDDKIAMKRLNFCYSVSHLIMSCWSAEKMNTMLMHLVEMA